MARVQAEYQQRVAAPQAVAAPRIQAEQFSSDPGESSAFQLMHALGVADVRPVANGLIEDAKAKEEAAARAYANSMTIDELGRQIKSGEKLPSQSPVYVATVQHLYGENSMNQIENKMASDLTSGELKLDSPEAVDKYLTDARNTHLAGQSPYTIAGFDKGWGKLRESMITANTRMQDKEYTAHAVATSTEALTNLATKDATGTVQEQALALVDMHELLRGNGVLMTPDASRDALKGVLAAAAAGNKDLVDAFLDASLDNGLKVSGVVGVEQGITYSHQADAKRKSVDNQRVDTEIRPFYMAADKGELDVKKFDEYVDAHEEFITTSIYHHVISSNERAVELRKKQNVLATFEASRVQSDLIARRTIGASLASGTFSQLPMQKVVGADGKLEDAKQLEIAQEILVEQTKDMPIELQISVFSRNNVPYVALKTRLLGGLSNLASIGWKYDGKNIGELSPVGMAAFDEFIKVNKVNPDYVKNLVGEKAYSTLTEIEFMNVQGGAGGVREAARVVNEAKQSGITQEDFDKNYRVSVNAAVSRVVNDTADPWAVPVISKAWWRGLFGNQTPNLTVMHSLIRKHTELLVRSGVEPDTAVETSVKYLADPSRSTKINNTIYPNSALPQVPQGEQIGKWMERFTKEVPQRISTDLHVESANIVLMPQTTGSFIAMNGGLPVHDKDGNTIQFTKEEFQQWVQTSMKADTHKKADEANYGLFKARIEKEMIKTLPRDSLPGAGQGDRTTVLRTVGSRESYDRFLKEGLVDKPINDLKKIHKGWNPQPAGWQPFAE